jgi:hypothetical protein
LNQRAFDKPVSHDDHNKHERNPLHAEAVRSLSGPTSSWDTATGAAGDFKDGAFAGFENAEKRDLSKMTGGVINVPQDKIPDSFSGKAGDFAGNLAYTRGKTTAIIGGLVVIGLL